jgi:hypothetical protein
VGEISLQVILYNVYIPFYSAHRQKRKGETVRINASPAYRKSKPTHLNTEDGSRMNLRNVSNTSYIHKIVATREKRTEINN